MICMLMHLFTAFVLTPFYFFGCTFEYSFFNSVYDAIGMKEQAGISTADAAKRAVHARQDVTLRIYSHALKKNDLHCCEAVTKAMPKMPRQVTG